jgi:ethanolamine ammonia-lyase large subunit
MFEVGDVVTLSNIGHNIYKTKLYKQTYIITWSHERWGVKVKGLTNGLEICYSNHIVEYETDYLRKLKLKEICSKLEM